jgi:hypothetical protein
MALLLLAVASDESISWAQVAAPPPAEWFAPPAGYGYGGYGFSSTLAEGAQRGYADVIRSQGMAAEAVSRAAINFQDARSAWLDNQLKWTRTYWARRRLGESEIAADQAKRREARDRYLAQKPSGAPPRLSASQLDPSTGAIAWPRALQQQAYADQRQRLEELVALRTHTTETYELSDAIYDAADQMRNELRQNMQGMNPNDYIAARKFLDSLAYESRRPAG